MTITVEKTVPLPERRNNTKKYPFDQMEIGDSFFVELAQGKKPYTLKQAVNKANNKFKGAQHYIVREVQGGARVWRDA